MRTQLQFKTKTGKILFGWGITLTLASLLSALAIFGLTFGTVFIMAVGMFIAFFGLTYAKVSDAKIDRLLLRSRLFLLGVLLLGVISFVWIETLVLQAARPDSVVNAKYAVVLGAGLRGDQPSQTLKNRLDKGVEYLRENPEAKIVAAGGVGAAATLSEAEVMKRYLTAQGIAETRVLLEDKSRTTDENLKFTKALIIAREGMPAHSIAVITSDYHLYRAKQIAGKYYPQVQGLAAESALMLKINYAIREYFAVIKFWLQEEMNVGSDGTVTVGNA
mgnify:CR=1 FL=1